jgi:CO/xanthine dehydrogenase Mo-binding subunit
MIAKGLGAGLGYALSEEIKTEGGRVTNPDFRGYGILRAPDMPQVECHFVEKGDGPGL